MEKLDGSWKLVYTSNSELIALLALSRLPFVTIGDVTQRVDAASSTVENKVRRWGCWGCWWLALRLLLPAAKARVECLGARP